MKRLLISILFISSSSFAAGIQKWVDESGQIHYGDTPPVKTKSESVQVSRPPSNPGKPLPRFTGSKNQEGSEQNAENQQPPKKETSKDQTKDICAQAKKDLIVINRSTRIRLRQSDGTERYMTPEELEQRKVQTEKDIKQYCK